MTFGNSNVILRSASDCKTSIGADGDTSICTWDVEAGVLQHTSPLRRRCRLIGTPRHGSIVAVGSSNGSGVVCNTQDGTCFRIQEAGDVSSLTPDASYLITTSLKDGVALTAWGLPPVRGVHEEGKSERGAHSVSPSISDTEESRGWPELDGESFHGPQVRSAENVVRPPLTSRSQRLRLTRSQYHRMAYLPLQGPPKTAICFCGM